MCVALPRTLVLGLGLEPGGQARQALVLPLLPQLEDARADQPVDGVVERPAQGVRRPERKAARLSRLTSPGLGDKTT